MPVFAALKPAVLVFLDYLDLHNAEGYVNSRLSQGPFVLLCLEIRRLPQGFEFQRQVLEVPSSPDPQHLGLRTNNRLGVVLQLDTSGNHLLNAILELI